LSGVLPSELGLVGQNLEWLYVNHNSNIIGMIPSELGNLKGLTHFYGHDTQLIGAIPQEVAALAQEGSLTDFHVERTLLYGTIPVNMCVIADLTFDCYGALCGCECACVPHQVTQSVNCLETPELCR